MTWKRASLIWSASIVFLVIPSYGQGIVSFSRVEAQPVLNAPYSAVEETEHNQTLSDGTHMVTRNQTREYRDSYGRTRKESSFIRAGVAEEPRTIVINDPIAGTSYTLFVRSALLSQKPRRSHFRTIRMFCSSRSLLPMACILSPLPRNWARKR